MNLWVLVPMLLVLAISIVFLIIALNITGRNGGTVPYLSFQESPPTFQGPPTRMVKARITSMRWANNVGIDDVRRGTKWVEPETDGLLCAEWIDPETGDIHEFQEDTDF